jgi:hypothetical protein
MKKAKSKIWERLIPLSKTNRGWDIDFWQSQKPEVRFRAVWNLAVDFYRIRGEKINANTLRLQRTIENIEQTPGKKTKRDVNGRDLDSLRYVLKKRKSY